MLRLIQNFTIDASFVRKKFDSSGEMGRHIGCKHTRDGEAFLNIAEKEMDLEAVQVRIDIFGSPAFEESLDLEPDTTANLESLECKFCERRFDSSGEMGRHIGCKHKLNIHQEVTRDGEAFLSCKLAGKLGDKFQESLDHMAEDDLAEKEINLEAVQVSMDIFGF